MSKQFINQAELLIPGRQILLVNGKAVNSQYPNPNPMIANATNVVVDENVNIQQIFPQMTDAKIFQPLIQAHAKNESTNLSKRAKLTVRAMTFVNNVDESEPVIMDSKETEINPDSISKNDVETGVQVLDVQPTIEFRYYYQYVINYSGTYELIVYITFRRVKKGVQPVHSVSAYSHDLEFFPQSFRNFDYDLIPFEDVGNVRVFLINRNPETSRGTETVVQGT